MNKLLNKGFLLAVGVLRLAGAEEEHRGRNLDAVVVLELRRHPHPLPVHDRAVPAAEVHHVIAAIALCVDDRVPPGDLGVVDRHRVLRQAPDGAGSLQRELLSGFCF